MICSSMLRCNMRLDACRAASAVSTADTLLNLLAVRFNLSIMSTLLSSSQVSLQESLQGYPSQSLLDLPAKHGTTFTTLFCMKTLLKLHVWLVQTAEPASLLLSLFYPSVQKEQQPPIPTGHPCELWHAFPLNLQNLGTVPLWNQNGPEGSLTHFLSRLCKL